MRDYIGQPRAYFANDIADFKKNKHKIKGPPLGKLAGVSADLNIAWIYIPDVKYEVGEATSFNEMDGRFVFLYDKNPRVEETTFWMNGYCQRSFESFVTVGNSSSNGKIKLVKLLHNLPYDLSFICDFFGNNKRLSEEMPKEYIDKIFAKA